MAELTRVEERMVQNSIARYHKKIEHVDNSSLPAGSPMYFYCRACGIHVATLPEDYLTPPPKLCEDCADLKKQALLEEAQRRAAGN